MKYTYKNPYGYIYCLIHRESGKRYIGQTISDPYRYFAREYKATRSGGNRKYLRHAIKKYGIDSFDFIILCRTLSEKMLNKKEKYFIRKYKCMNRKYGFNLRTGGANGKHSDESKKLISIGHKGKKMGLEHRRALIATIRHKDGKEVMGCISELARKHNFCQRHMSSRGKSKGWILIKLTTKDGIEQKLPKIPNDKDKCFGLNIYNAKIITIRNAVNGWEDTGGISILMRQYNFRYDIMKFGKSKGWLLIKITDINGKIYPLPIIKANMRKGINHYKAKIITIRNIKTGEKDSGCIIELARKHNLPAGSLSLNSGRSGDWVSVGSKADKKLKNT